MDRGHASLYQCILGVLMTIMLALPAAMSRFEDASSASDFGYLNINAPWAGDAYGNIRLIDLDADGTDEILVGAYQFDCSQPIPQVSLFRRNQATNSYAQLNFGQFGEFLGIRYYASIFEALGRSGSALPDIIACLDSSFALAVLENHGGLNFSISGVAFSSAVVCDLTFTVLAVADTDHDGRDEVFSSSKYSTHFFTRLPNTTLVSAASRFPVLPVLSRPAGAFADLDGDSYYKDLIWTGELSSSFYPAYIFRNVGGNFSNVVNSIDGVLDGSIAVAEFTGDERDDVVVSGTLVNGSGSVSLYANNGSISFLRRSDAGYSVPSSVKFTVAAVPLRSQAIALDLFIVSSAYSLFSIVSANINNGSGYFSPSDASWLPAAFKGAVVRGPDIGANPSFLAMGRTTSSSYDGSTLVGYLDSGTLISYASNLFETPKRAISLTNGVVSAADFNYDGCTDAILSGYSTFDYYYQSALLAGDCTGSLQLQSFGLQPISDGAASVRDFDHDGRLEYFATGVINHYTSVSETFYYRFNADGIPENASSNLPPLLGLAYSAVCVGAASGSNFDDIYVTGNNSGTNLQYFLRNVRNGSFSIATSDLFGMVPVDFGSCVFASSAVGASASSAWMNMFSVGRDTLLTTAFNYMRNNLNGTFTNLVNSSAAFPGGIPNGCYYSSMVGTDLNGDGRDDLFYNGFITSASISRLYLRDANGSMILSTGLDATGTLTQLWFSSSVAVDIDSDGDMDLVVAGQNIDKANIMAGLLNDGSGNFTDETPQVFGSLPGFSHGALAVAQFTNDSLPDLIHIGLGDFCGPRVLLQRANVSASSSTSSSSLPSSSSGSSSSSLAALGGGLGGGLGFLLLLCACCCVLTILCCCCALCLVVILAIVAVALVVIVAVAVGLFAAGDAGVVFFLVRSKRGKKKEDVEMDEMDATTLLADAERTSEYRVIPWPEIHPVKKLGAGAYGEVMLAEWNGVEVAVKLFRNPSKEAIDEFKHEALMMAKVSHHPNVVNFIGASFPPDGMAMVLGLCAGGSLLAALEKKKLDAAKKTKVLGEVASALSFLHSLGIVHRDIAARNVLLDGSEKAKLADLGLSRLLEDKQGEQTTSSTLGPVRWMAPEAIRSRMYSSASDAFSFGVLMAEVWSDGAVPFADMTSVADVAIAVLQQGARPYIAPATPSSQAELMRQLFSADPARRPSMEDVLRALQSKDDDERSNFDAENNDEGDRGEYVGADVF